MRWASSLTNGALLISQFMKNVENPKLMWLKASLLLLIGSSSACLLFLTMLSLRTGLLLALAIWAFCRTYYFAFYVIEHYVDSSYRFSGLFSFVSYVLRKRR